MCFFIHKPYPAALIYPKAVIPFRLPKAISRNLKQIMMNLGKLIKKKSSPTLCWSSVLEHFNPAILNMGHQRLPYVFYISTHRETRNTNAPLWIWAISARASRLLQKARAMHLRCRLHVHRACVKRHMRCTNSHAYRAYPKRLARCTSNIARAHRAYVKRHTRCTISRAHRAYQSKLVRCTIC